MTHNGRGKQEPIFFNCGMRHFNKHYRQNLMVRIRHDEQQRKRDEWLALSEEERQAIIQKQRQKWFDELSERCPQWNCECKHAFAFRSQEDLIESPFQCPTCDRVYDGRDWFRTTQLYDAITDWENLQTELSCLIGEFSIKLEAGEVIEKSSVDEIEDWALSLMNICDQVTHQDVTPIWKLAEVLWGHRPPLTADEIANARAAEAACLPLINLLWRKAKTRPMDPNEWLTADERTEHKTLRVRPKLRPQQQEIIDVIREAGHRLTTDEILTALDNKGKRRSEGTTKTTLAALVQFGPLTNTTDRYGRGYGLPEWTTE